MNVTNSVSLTVARVSLGYTYIKISKHVINTSVL